ncbi:MAG: Mn2+ or Mg2+-dependent serine/threonine phosphatase [Idiomarinaceae bacterium HL-53]|nr:MAG: Mn2+ or Mg2+-dependent serine/threonine phosphatase [Idiomarinaceae bacterium HL-53]CUS48996.1 Serine/threonine protein phosphatase PrpC [Idiomarinaceae bacterium HL-53]
MQANFYDGAIIGQREEQQDDRTNLILHEGYRLYVLADGMGGHNAGNVASKLVCSAFRDFFSDLAAINDSEKALKEALNHANEVMRGKLDEMPELQGMGTTVIAVLLHEPTGQYSFISVGDSPLYKYSEGRLQRINDNHAFYEDLKRLVAAGEMSQEEADTHPDRHAITSAVMGRVIEKFDVKSGQFAAGELIILASDGLQTLTDTEDGEIAQVLQSAQADPEQSVIQLLAAVEEKGISHQDNTTIIVVRSENEASVTSTPPEQANEELQVTSEQAPKTQVEIPQKSSGQPAKKSSSKVWVWLLLIGVVAAILWIASPELRTFVFDLVEKYTNA